MKLLSNITPTFLADLAGLVLTPRRSIGNIERCNQAYWYLWGERQGQRDVSWDVSWREQLKWLNGQTVGGCYKEMGHKNEKLQRVKMKVKVCMKDQSYGNVCLHLPALSFKNAIKLLQFIKIPIKCCVMLSHAESCWIMLSYRYVFLAAGKIPTDPKPSVNALLWHFITLASSVDGDVNGAPVGRNWLRQWFQTLNLSFTFTFYI